MKPEIVSLDTLDQEKLMAFATYDLYPYEIQEVLFQLTSSLTDRERIAVYLRFWCDLTYREMGDIMETSSAYCNQITTRALNKMKARKFIRTFGKMPKDEAREICLRSR